MTSIYEHEKVRRVLVPEWTTYEHEKVRRVLVPEWTLDSPV
jgi:hypothetical protein